MSPVDGDISPDNLRYYYLLKETATMYGGILNIKVLDGSVIKFIMFGDNTMTPYALASSFMDRVSVITEVDVGSSIYFYDTSLTSNNLVVMHWDTNFFETVCTQFALSVANTFTTYFWLISASVPALPNFKTSGAPTFAIFSVNCNPVDTTSANTAVAVANIVYKDLGSTCTTNGQRFYIPL